MIFHLRKVAFFSFILLASAMHPADAVAVPAPTGVRATDGIFTSVRIYWNAVSGATGYRVYRNTTNYPSTAIYRFSTSSTYVEDHSVIPGQTYYYWVRAVEDIAGVIYLSPFSSSNAGSAADNIPAPKGVSASDGTYKDKVVVRWDAVSGATGYSLYRNTINDPSTAIRRFSTSATSGDDDNVIQGQTYYYWVQAWESDFGDLSIRRGPFSSPDTGYAADSNPTPTSTYTPSPTGTSTPTPSTTNTPTASPSATSSPTPTATNTPTSTQTVSPTSTSTATLSSTPSHTSTPEPTRTATLPPTVTKTPTVVPTPTQSPTATRTRNGPLINFDSLLVNRVVDQDFLDLGVRFHSSARVVSTAVAPSSPNVIRNEAGSDIQITFHIPGSLDPAMTSFVGFKKPAGFLPGCAIELYDARGSLLDETASSVVAEERFGFYRPGIARLLLRPPGVGILVAMDDLEFDTPGLPGSLDLTGDGKIDSRDLLMLLDMMGGGAEPTDRLFDMASEWAP